MSFQWNHTGQSRQVGDDRGQSASLWSNQEPYGNSQGNIPANQHNVFQDSVTPSNNWNTGVPYQHQWCPSTSQEQVNWGCPNFPTNPYDQQVMSNNFTPNSNVYSTYLQDKTDYGDSFSDLFDNQERNSGFNNYQMTNSLMSGQANSSFGMPQNNYMSNCREASKVSRNHDTNSSFPYWDQSTNRNDTMNYVPSPLYNNHACENVASSNMTYKATEIGTKMLQSETVQKYHKKADMPQHRQIYNTDMLNSSSAPPDYNMANMMSHKNITSNMAPIDNERKGHDYFYSFNRGNSSKAANSSLAVANPSLAAVNSSLAMAKSSDNNMNSRGATSFDSNLKVKPPMTFLPKRDELNDEVIFQRKIMFMQKRIQEKTFEFENMKRLSGVSNCEKTYGEMYHLITEIKVLESEIENIESDIKLKMMGYNVPSCIGPNDHGPSFRSEFGQMNNDEFTMSGKHVSVKSLKQQLGSLRDQVSHHLNVETRPDLPPPDTGMPKTKRNEEQTDSAGNAKTSSVKQMRRAVLKYLLKLSGRIEKCFSELRTVKRILKGNPNDREVIQILHKVGMHINQSRVSLKEKKKLCAKSNIRLRSLTIKATGTNILQTLENDMYHLRRFYTALSHIARHLGTIKKPQEREHLASEADSASQSADDVGGFMSENDTNNCSSIQANFFSPPTNGSTSSVESFNQKKSSIRDACLNGPPQKSARFMLLEKKFWDKLMEMSYLVRSKILALRRAERTYKNGDKGSLPELRLICELPRKSWKRELKLLADWKDKYSFSRHIPSYILQSYPEEERRSRDKITLKSVRKSLAKFVSLCYSARVLIKSDTSYSTEPDGNIDLKEEAKFWKRIFVLGQKIQMFHTELSNSKLKLSTGGQDKKSLDSLVRIEAKIKEIHTEIGKEEALKQKHGFRDHMPSNAEIKRMKIGVDGCKNFHGLKESFQNLQILLSEIKLSSQVASMPNPGLFAVNSEKLRNVSAQTLIKELPSDLALAAMNTEKPRNVSAQTLIKELPSDLAQFLGDGSDGWI